jgi:phosphopantetheine adenylyltransferase
VKLIHAIDQGQQEKKREEVNPPRRRKRNVQQFLEDIL